MNNPIGAVLAAALCGFGLAAAAGAQQNFDAIQVHSLKVRDNLYMLVGAGGNITMQLGDDGILLVDTQYAPLSQKILAEIRKISDKPIRVIVNTHHHGDHVGGNASLRAAGSTVSGGNMAGAIADAGVGAAIIAHENVLLRLSALKGAQAVPSGALPTSTYFDAKKELYYNGEGIEIEHQPAAHTDSDSIVFFRKSDVISAGDVFVTTSYPVIDIEGGGSYQGIIKALDRLVDLIIPVYGQDGGTLVVPGHGRLSNLGDVLNFREMVLVVHDRLKSMIDSGLTLEEVKAAMPTFDYDPVYGATTGFWTTDKFVEAAYRSIKSPPQEPK
jgi:glyoxylase-like metal-dependent hydrolase (beta-lactamase superfamily II)